MEAQNTRVNSSIIPARLSTSVVLPSDGTVLASPRLSALDHYRRLYGYNDPLYQIPVIPAVNQAVVDDIIDKYVRKPDGSPVKTAEEKRAYGSLSPSAAALVKAEDTVNALKQSGVNPVSATDKALTDAGLLNHYGLAPLSPIYNQYPYHYGYYPYYNHQIKDKDGKETVDPYHRYDPLGYRSSGYPYDHRYGYPYYGSYQYGYPTVAAPKTEEKPVEKCHTECSEKEKACPCPEKHDVQRVDPIRQSQTLNDSDFYKKYGFYPHDRYYSGYPYGSNYGYPYGSNYYGYGYPQGSNYYGYNYPYGRTSYVNADGKVVDIPLASNVPTGYSRQYSAPTEQTQVKSNSNSRKPSQQVEDNEKFDFEGEKKKSN